MPKYNVLSPFLDGNGVSHEIGEEVDLHEDLAAQLGAGVLELVVEPVEQPKQDPPKEDQAKEEQPVQDPAESAHNGAGEEPKPSVTNEPVEPHEPVKAKSEANEKGWAGNHTV